VVFTFFPEPLVRQFSKDPAVVAIGVQLIRIAAVFQFFDGIQAVSAGALRGAADVKYPFWAMLACHWGIGFTVAIALGFGLGWGALGFWFGLTAGLIAVAAVLSRRFWMLSKHTIARL
jgi:multidrug resistance protein, MATE family